MKQIKTAKAWGAISDQGNLLPWAHHSDNCESGFANPVVIVHGLTEAEVQEAAELLEKSREVCEWDYSLGEWIPPSDCETQAVFLGDAPKFCPSCGRKVVVK